MCEMCVRCLHSEVFPAVLESLAGAFLPAPAEKILPRIGLRDTLTFGVGLDRSPSYTNFSRLNMDPKSPKISRRFAPKYPLEWFKNGIKIVKFFSALRAEIPSRMVQKRHYNITFLRCLFSGPPRHRAVAPLIYGSPGLTSFETRGVHV